jgi:hypothetical protein
VLSTSAEFHAKISKESYTPVAMRTKTRILLTVALLLAGGAALAGSSTEPFGTIPPERRESLKNRLALYVKENGARDWSKLYDLVSDTGRGGVSRETFVTSMREAHGKSFASYPDLLEFLPDRATAREGDGYDIYGCGKAQREGVTYNGIAVAHAGYEHNDWFFTGWRFTEFPNEPCRHLGKPNWNDETPMSWDRPMEELRALP